LDTLGLGDFFLLIALAASIWVAIDSSKLLREIPAGRLKTEWYEATSPTAWFFYCLIIWVVAIPVYLAVSRPKYISLAESDQGLPGFFIVTGVMRETREDVRDSIHAESLENAKVKAELSGIVVTKVERA
jgi:hypothetical protein